MSGADRYELLDVIGHGSSGVVHLAWDRRQKRYVAAKVLSTPETNDLAKHRFLNEQQVAVDHPHLLTPLDWFHRPQTAILVMELADAGCIQDVLDANPVLSPSFVEQVADQSLAALAALHDAGILHRDIKPANLMLARVGDGVTLKLGDFGIAIAEGTTRLTQDVTAVGTLGYLAPEVVAGSDNSVRSDLWSLGRTLDDLVRRCDPPASRRLVDLVSSMTATDPDDRPPNAIDASRRLDAVTDDSPLALPVVPDRVAASVRRHVGRRRRRRVLIATSTLLTLLLVGAMVHTSLRDDAAPRPAWLTRRISLMASGRTECLTFATSSSTTTRKNIVVPTDRSARAYTRRGTGDRSFLVTLSSSTTITPVSSAGVPSRIGSFDVHLPTDPVGRSTRWTFDWGGRTWTVTAGEIELTDRVSKGRDRALRDFVRNLRVERDRLVVGDRYDEVGALERALPVWGVVSGTSELLAYRDSSTRLDTLPGTRTTVLGHPATVDRMSITWRETPGLVLVLTRTDRFPAGSSVPAHQKLWSAFAVDDADEFVRERRTAAERLRPCSAADYRRMPAPDETRTTGLVLRSSDGPSSLEIVGADEFASGALASPRVLGRLGTEGLAVTRYELDATGIRVWAVPDLHGRWPTSMAVPECATQLAYPEATLQVVDFEPTCAVEAPESVPGPAETRSPVFCGVGSVVVRIEPGLADAPRANTVTLGGPSLPSACTTTDPRSFRIEAASFEFDEVGCRSILSSARARGTLRWGDGSTSAADITLDFGDVYGLTIRIADGVYEGYAGDLATTLYPVEGSCGDDGVVLGVIGFPGVVLVPPAS